MHLLYGDPPPIDMHTNLLYIHPGLFMLYLTSHIFTIEHDIHLKGQAGMGRGGSGRPLKQKVIIKDTKKKKK